MYTVAIIGVGQLGSRHLQGLTSTKNKINIELVEPFEAAQVTAKQRFDEMPNNENIHSLIFHDSLEGLSNELDIVIIATNSDVRYRLAKELLETKKVQYILFEKVLFQSYAEYDDMKNLLNNHNVKAWVNHPRRLFSFYHQYLDEFQSSTRINYHVEGGLWALCSNSLHYIDHMMQLQKELLPDININTHNLDDTLLASKRANYLEVCGSLHGTIGNCDFTLSCNDTVASAPIINILSDTVKMTIDEVSGWARIATKKNGWKWEEYQGKIVYYQSELTGEVIDDILTTKESMLPTYEEAMHLHKPFIREIQKKLDSLTNETLHLCPIS